MIVRETFIFGLQSTCLLSRRLNNTTRTFSKDLKLFRTALTAASTHHATTIVVQSESELRIVRATIRTRNDLA
eukprot:scaffold2751_cov131-Cylindrotheca_fusiformis.AAC.19